MGIDRGRRIFVSPHCIKRFVEVVRGEEYDDTKYIPEGVYKWAIGCVSWVFHSGGVEVESGQYGLKGEERCYGYRCEVEGICIVLIVKGEGYEEEGGVVGVTVLREDVYVNNALSLSGIRRSGEGGGRSKGSVRRRRNEKLRRSGKFSGGIGDEEDNVIK